MSDQSDAVRRLAQKLILLADFSPSGKEELADWYRMAREIEDDLVREGGLSPVMPHFLWHYLADADVRLKDSEYAELQNRCIRLLINQLESGRVPSDDDIGQWSR